MSNLSTQIYMAQTLAAPRNKLRISPKRLFRGETEFSDLIRNAFLYLVDDNQLDHKTVNLTVDRYSEKRNDRGDWRVVEADFMGSRGQASTYFDGDFTGISLTLAAVGELKTNDCFRRAILVATLNALARFLGIVDRTVRCTGSKPAKCAAGLVTLVKVKHGHPRIALIGFHPIMAEILSREFRLRITDPNQKNQGMVVRGIPVQDPKHTAENIAWSDYVVVSGHALNREILQELATGSPKIAYTSGCRLPRMSLNSCLKKPTIFCGVTGAASAHLFMLPRYCPYGS